MLLDEYYRYIAGAERIELAKMITFNLVRDLLGGDKIIRMWWDNKTDPQKEVFLTGWLAKVQGTIKNGTHEHNPSKQSALTAINAIKRLTEIPPESEMSMNESSGYTQLRGILPLLNAQLNTLESFVSNTVVAETVRDVINVMNPQLGKDIDNALNPLCDLYFSATQLEIIQSSMGAAERIGEVEVDGTVKQFTTQMMHGLKPTIMIDDWVFIGTFRRDDIKKPLL